jgi:hypothetical protein
MSYDGSYAWAKAQRSYLRAALKAKFTETELRLVLWVIFYSAGRQRHRAHVPKQYFFTMLGGIDVGDVSRALASLEESRVIERPSGYEYCLVAPPWLKVSLRVDETRESLQLEHWLETVEANQPDLFPPPPSLADAMRENFVESSRVEPVIESRLTKASSRSSDPNVEGDAPMAVTTAGPVTGWKDPVPAGPVGNFPTQLGNSPSSKPSQIGKFPTSPPPYPPYSQLENSSSRILGSREGIREGAGTKGVRALDYQAYVEHRLFASIGEQERTGRCRLMWARAVREIPEQLDELLGHALMLRATTQPNLKLGAWLNRAVYRELQAKG